MRPLMLKGGLISRVFQILWQGHIPANSHALGVILTPAGWKLRSHAGSRLRAIISHAWLKIVSCCHLAWHNFQKYVNSDPCKERKPCVKWINDNTFLTISDFVDKHFLDNFAFGRLRTSSEDFGLLRKTSDFFGNLRKWSCRLQKSQHSQDKNLTLISQKKLAGIQWT